MRSIFLLIVIFSSFQAKSQEQDNWPHGDWYNIVDKGLLHFRIGEKEIEQEAQTFLYGRMKKSPRVSTVIDVVYKNDLVCFISKSNTEGRDWMEGVVFRKGKDSTYIDMILNCPEETDRDTATMKKMFYSCDSSTYLTVRYYNRKAIERFRLLKPVKDITIADLKKARELFDLKKESLKKKFNPELLSWVEPMLHMQEITEILVGLGYNPMLSTSEYKNLFSVSM
jgi:hypothetical protein